MHFFPPYAAAAGISFHNNSWVWCRLYAHAEALEKACISTTPEALKAISSLFRSQDGDIDAKAISLTYLRGKSHGELRDSSTAQANAVYMLARCTAVLSSLRELYGPISFTP